MVKLGDFKSMSEKSGLERRDSTRQIQHYYVNEVKGGSKEKQSDVH